MVCVQNWIKAKKTRSSPASFHFRHLNLYLAQHVRKDWLILFCLNSQWNIPSDYKLIGWWNSFGLEIECVAFTFGSNRLSTSLFKILLCNALLQHFYTTFFSNASLQHFSVTLFSNTSLQHPSPQHVSTTLFSNTSLQHSSPALVYSTSPTLLYSTSLHTLLPHPPPTL